MSLLYHLACVVGAELALADIAWRWLKRYRAQGQLGVGIAVIVFWGIVAAFVGFAIADLLVLL